MLSISTPGLIARKRMEKLKGFGGYFMKNVFCVKIKH